MKSLVRWLCFLLMLAGLPGGLLAERVQEDPAPVVLVSYNLCNYLLQPVAGPDGRPTTPAKTPEAIEAAVRIISSLRPDILGLQEIGTREDLADLQKRLAAAGCDLPHALWVDGPDQERHLALLTRLPVLSEQHALREEFELDGLPRLVQRGFLDATLQLPDGRPLRVLGVHLKSRRPDPAFDQAAFRRFEARRLRQRLEHILSGNAQAMLVVFGDFNDTKDSPVVRDVAGRAGSPAFMEVLRLADPDGERWTHHWEETDEYSRIDYLLVSPALRPWVDRGRSGIAKLPAWRAASDHRPLVLTLADPGR